MSDLSFTPATLEAFATDVLRAIGMAEVDAVPTARGLVVANLHGVDSHGIARLPQYVESLTVGDVNLTPYVTVEASGQAATFVDANGGYGYRPSYLAIEACISNAEKSGIAIAAVSNSHHFGMASTYTREAAAKGQIAFAWTNASPKLTPPGGVQPVVGNNPLSWAIPRSGGSDPIVLDMALSTVAFGKVRLARQEGRPIPLGWGLDRNGQPTSDAEEAFQSGLLDAVGGYKGYGLSIIAEILAGVLTGSPFGKDGAPHGNGTGGVGHIFITFRPDLFVSRERFDADVDELVNQIHGARMGREGDRALLPGEIESGNAARITVSGISLSAVLFASLDKLAGGLSVAGLSARS
jgi:LDH2 family malate/lactate/ureidoglycolate dehydrogenase